MRALSALPCILSMTLLALIVPVNAEEGVPFKIGRDTFGFHVPVSMLGETVYGQPPDEHFVFMVEDALEALQHENNVLVLSVANFKNGVALMTKGRSGEMVRILAFDENELNVINTKSPLGRTNISIALLTIGHEIGHHVCGHISGRQLPPWEQELEADRVGGSILEQSEWRRWFWRDADKGELELDDLIEAGRKVLGSEEGSATHPPLSKRLDAIRAGWAEGRANRECIETDNGDARIRGCTEVVNRGWTVACTAQGANVGWAHKNRGDANIVKGNYDPALSDYSKAIEINTKDAAAYGGRAWAYFKAGKAAQGLPDASKALELKPNDSNALNTRGHIFEVLGRRINAIADFKQALKNDPDLQQSKDGLKRLSGKPN